MSAARDRLAQIFAEHQDVSRASESLAPQVEAAADMLSECLASGGTIYLCGNGGSAADAQHIAGEWVGRFLLERRGLPAVALHTNTTVVTAIANDYGFDQVYARQIEAHGRAGDVLIALSTSGSSANILRAAERAKELSMKVIGMTARSGGKLSELSDVLLPIPTDVTARAQEIHILIGHMLCELTERRLCEETS